MDLKQKNTRFLFPVFVFVFLVEAVYTIKALQEQICPPTLNLEDPDDEVKDMDLVPLKPKKKEIKAAMSNSFGFGGTNSSIIFKKYTD